MLAPKWTTHPRLASQGHTSRPHHIQAAGDDLTIGLVTAPLVPPRVELPRFVWQGGPSLCLG